MTLPDLEPVVLRLSWRPVARAIIGLGLLGVLLAAFGTVGVLLLGESQMLVMLILAVPALGVAGFLAFATARARTRIEPHGIVNRALWQVTTIPWADVAGVGVEPMGPNRIVRIRCHGGDSVILAALRDGPSAPDPHFDATVATIRSRWQDAPAAAAHDVAEDQSQSIRPAARGYPFSLRPARRPLLLMLPLAVAATAALGVVMPTRGMGVYMLIPLAIVLWRYVLVMLLGWTAVDDQGITNRGVLGRRHIPWEEVESLAVLTTLFGRTVLVTAKGRRRPSALSAPREGLLARGSGFADTLAQMEALAEPHGLSVQPGTSRRVVWILLAAGLVLAVALSAALEPPWKRPWWPWLHEAGGIEEPCALGDAEDLVDAPLEENFTDRTLASEWTCEWDALPEEWASLRVDYELHEHLGDSSGTDRARDALATRRDVLATEAEEPMGLGEEAVIEVEPLGAEEEATLVRVLARTANVLVALSYTAEGPAEEVEAEAYEATRSALDRVSPTR